MTKKALLVIDYTNDFVATKGKLTVGEIGQKLEDNILQAIKTFFANGDYVIFPTDTHYLNDLFSPESKLFPPHNIQRTWGHELYGKVGDWYFENQTAPNVYKFDKNRYSAFQNTNLDNFLRERNIKDLTLVGTCTDICVLHTAIYAYNLNYQLTILKNSVATFTEHGQEWSFDHFKNVLGAKVV